MKCLVCGKNYISVGVHAKHKHGITANEYRVQFGLMRSRALVDHELSEHLSTQAKRSMALKPELRQERVERCANNSQSLTGLRWKNEVSEETSARYKANNTRRNIQYLQTKALEVAGILRTSKTILAVKEATGMGSQGIKKIVAMGLAHYNPQDAKQTRDVRSNATHQAKRALRIEAYSRNLGKASSAAEMCRISGITIKTYKNWLASGVIDKHPRNIQAPWNPVKPSKPLQNKDTV